MARGAQAAGLSTDRSLVREGERSAEVPLWLVLEMCCSTEWRFSLDQDTRNSLLVFLSLGRLDVRYRFSWAFPALSESEVYPPEDWDQHPGGVDSDQQDRWVAEMAQRLGWSSIMMSPFAEGANPQAESADKHLCGPRCEDHSCPSCEECSLDPQHYGCRFCGDCECQGEC